jgi:hypothetical protein
VGLSSIIVSVCHQAILYIYPLRYFLIKKEREKKKKAEGAKKLERAAPKKERKKKKESEKKFRSVCIFSCPCAELYHCLFELGPGQV